MAGWPVWLASVSKRDMQRGGIVPTPRWGNAGLAKAEKILRGVLDGVGDETRERYFRLNVTACFQRALSQAEYDVLPQSWLDAPGVDTAGIPVEVLWEKGIPDIPSTKPCADPGKEFLDRLDLNLWIPVPCGKCPSCLARAELVAKEVARAAALKEPPAGPPELARPTPDSQSPAAAATPAG